MTFVNPSLYWPHEATSLVRFGWDPSRWWISGLGWAAAHLPGSLALQAVIANLAWLVEFVLAALGAYLYRRRRFTLLWLWLGFRAVADLACFVAKLASPRAYLWADYLQRTAQYVLFAAVAVYAAGRILREAERTGRVYLLGISTMMALAIAAVHAMRPITAQAVLSLEVWAELLLGAFMCVAMGTASGRAPRPWGLIGCGLVTMAAWDGGLTLLKQHGRNFDAWLPLGAIAGLAMLAWTGWRDYRLDEARVPLGKLIAPGPICAAGSRIEHDTTYQQDPLSQDTMAS